MQDNYDLFFDALGLGVAPGNRVQLELFEQAGHVREVLEAVRDRCQRPSVRQFAKQAKLDEGNLVTC